MGYNHDHADFGKEVLQGADMRHEMGRYAAGARAIFEGIVPRDDNTWANSVHVETVIEDSGGLRAVGKLVSTDPHAKSKEFGHTTRAKEYTTRGREKKRRRVRFVAGSRSMNKAMRAATSGGGEMGSGRRGRR